VVLTQWLYPGFGGRNSEYVAVAEFGYCVWTLIGLQWIVTRYVVQDSLTGRAGVF